MVFQKIHHISKQFPTVHYTSSCFWIKNLEATTCKRKYDRKDRKKEEYKKENQKKKKRKKENQKKKEKRKKK